MVILDLPSASGRIILHNGYSWEWSSLILTVHGEGVTKWNYLSDFSVGGAYAVPPDTLEEAIELMKVVP